VQRHLLNWIEVDSRQMTELCNCSLVSCYTPMNTNLNFVVSKWINISYAMWSETLLVGSNGVLYQYRIKTSKSALLFVFFNLMGDWLIDWCFTARQHKIGQLVPIYQGDYWLRRLRIANEEHTKTYSCAMPRTLRQSVHLCSPTRGSRDHYNG